jgi:polysaccharide export outer membrane protein
MKKILSLLAFHAALCATLCTSPQPAVAASLNQPAPAAMQEDEASADAAGPQFTIIPGDVLQVTVWKEEGLDQEVLVLTDGTINFPLIGSVEAAGRSPADLQAAIKLKLVKFIPDAAVSVSVKAALGHTVSVIGQVTKPGELLLGHGLTVMQALSQAGGLTPYANESRIIILHRVNGKETKIRFPYDDVAHGDDLEKDIVLAPGDVVVVPTAGLL